MKSGMLRIGIVFNHFNHNIAAVACANLSSASTSIKKRPPFKAAPIFTFQNFIIKLIYTGLLKFDLIAANLANLETGYAVCLIYDTDSGTFRT